MYVEHGAHEFWPTEAWAFDDAPNHDGDDADRSYLAAPPPNLGEVEAPSEVAEARLVLHYNGRWGAFSHKNDPPQARRSTTSGLADREHAAVKAPAAAGVLSEPDP